METHMGEIAEFRDQLAPESAELSLLSAKRGEMTDKLSPETSQTAAGATVSEDLKSVAENR